MAAGIPAEVGDGWLLGGEPDMLLETVTGRIESLTVTGHIQNCDPCETITASLQCNCRMQGPDVMPWSGNLSIRSICR